MHVKDDELASFWSMFLRKVPPHGGCTASGVPTVIFRTINHFALEAIELYSKEVDAFWCEASV